MAKVLKLVESWKELLRIAWPLIVANSFWNLQLTVDRIYLGNHSASSLAASIAVMSLFWAPMALLQQTAAYVTSFIAQYFGAHKKEMVGPVLWQSVYISIAGGLFFICFIFLSNDLFNFIDHPEKVKALEIKYFNIICYSALPISLVASLGGFFTGFGDTKKIIYINGFGLLVNIFLDYVLIFGHFGFSSYGIIGAGYATVIASWCSAILAAFMVFNYKYESSYKILSSWRLDLSILKKLLYFGVPSGFQWALEGLAFTVFLILIGRLKNGELALASSSIAVTLMMLSVLPAIGIAQAVMVLVGQHLGQNRSDLAEKSAWSGVQLAAIYMVCVSLSFVLIPQFYISWFLDPKNLMLFDDLSNMTQKILMFIAIFTCFDSVYLNLSFALKAAGDTRYVSIIALIMPWPIMIFPTYIFRDSTHAVFIAWGFATLYALTTAFIIFLRFKSEKWKKMSLV